MRYETEEIKRKIAIEKRVKKAIKIIIMLILSLLLVLNIILTIQHNKNVQYLPYDFYNIVSESMEPNISVNDLIIVKKCTQDELKKGDIITFKKEDNTTVTHRIYEVVQIEGKNEYVTKGDNNSSEDEENVKYENIYGKYFAKIKKIGKVINFLQNYNGIIIAIILTTMLIIVKTIVDDKKEKRKEKRVKFEIKQKREEYKKR